MEVQGVHVDPPRVPAFRPQRVVEPSQERPATTPEPRRTFADTLELGRLEARGNLPPKAWSAFAAESQPEPQHAPPAGAVEKRCPPMADQHAPKLGEVLKTPQAVQQEKIERVYRYELPYPRGTTIDLFI